MNSKLRSYEIQHAIDIHRLISKTLEEYGDSIKEIEYKVLEKGPGVILKIGFDNVQIYPSSSGLNIYLSVNGIARIVESFEEVQDVIEGEVFFYNLNKN